jgi:hypothetical protein
VLPKERKKDRKHGGQLISLLFAILNSYISSSKSKEKLKNPSTTWWEVHLEVYS